jgi:hypothetical protein
MGNHEERLQKLLDSRLKQFRNLPEFRIDKLLNLEKYGYHYYDRFYRLNHSFIITHGHRTSKQSAKFELEDWGISGASGHVHRFNTHKRNYHEEIKASNDEWYSFGTLADTRMLQYAKDFRSKWDNSFGIIEYDKEGFHVTPIFPSKLTGAFYCPLNGKTYDQEKKKKGSRLGKGRSTRKQANCLHV